MAQMREKSQVEITVVLKVIERLHFIISSM